MINITIDITPKNNDEPMVVAEISIMRIEKKNENEEYEYSYGGHWKDRDENVRYFNGKVWNKRENIIFSLANKIMEDILSNAS